MELDNLKNLWENDKVELPEVSISQQKKIFSPLQMIKVNMITEAILMTLIFIYLYSDFPFSDDLNVRAISEVEFLLSAGFVTYFYSRFIKLYRLINKGNYNTNYDLFNLKTQLLIAKEVYISYYVSTIAISTLYLLILLDFNFDKNYHIVIFSVLFLSEILLVCFNIKYWIYYMYGQYINIVINAVDELNGIPIHKKVISEKNWFKKTHSYLFRKFGIAGHVTNTVLWFIAAYTLLVLLFMIVALAMILAAWKLNFIDITLFLDALKSISE